MLNLHEEETTNSMKLVKDCFVVAGLITL